MAFFIITFIFKINSFNYNNKLSELPLTLDALLRLLEARNVADRVALAALKWKEGLH